MGAWLRSSRTLTKHMADLNQKVLTQVVTLRGAALTPTLDSTTQLVLDIPTQRALDANPRDLNTTWLRTL